jgi:asparagine N-glycosylation enzyme membrane subunit Stt3
MLTPLNRLAPAMPQPVFRAVQLMYTGAALTVLTTVVIILVAPRVGVLRIGTMSPVVQSHTQQVVRAVFGGSVACAAWLWMAWKNKNGRAWARVLSTVFFGLYCFGTVQDFTEGAIEVRALDAVIWLVALAATIELWRPGSGPFYREPLVLVKGR